jgi:hypothetical protein
MTTVLGAVATDPALRPLVTTCTRIRSRRRLLPDQNVYASIS